MKTLILAVILSLSFGAAHAQSKPYQAPAHNYNQNNWMSSAS